MMAVLISWRICIMRRCLRRLRRCGGRSGRGSSRWRRRGWSSSMPDGIRGLRLCRKPGVWLLVRRPTIRLVALSHHHCNNSGCSSSSRPDEIWVSPLCNAGLLSLLRILRSTGHRLRQWRLLHRRPHPRSNEGHTSLHHHLQSRQSHPPSSQALTPSDRPPLHPPVRSTQKPAPTSRHRPLPIRPRPLSPGASLRTP